MASIVRPVKMKIRRYASFEIRWDRGAVSTGYRTEREAQAVVDRSGERGTVVCRALYVEMAR